MSRFIQTHFDNGQPSNYNEYVEHPLVPLRIALESFFPMNDQLYHRIKSAERFCQHPSDSKLTIDESAAIYLYTEEYGDQSIHYMLNRALRSRNKTMIEPWFGFLKLFNTALQKLPTVKGTVWRAIHSDIAKNLRENEDIIWGSFSSCSSSFGLIKRFIDEKSILCSIEVINGKSVQGYTHYIKEHEVILLPSTRLRVKKNGYDSSVGSHIIHLVEMSNDKSISNSASSTNKSPSNLVDRNNTKDDIILSSTIFAKDEVYEVAYKDGKKQAYGVYFCANKDIIRGYLADIRANGRGSRTWTNGDRYVGNFKDGEMNGYGSLFYANGYVYKGNWITDEAWGHGTSTWKNGNHYEGYHTKGKIQGYGTFSSSKGDKYTGDLVNGKAHGTGVRLWQNGDRYNGSFKDDKKDGRGTYRFGKGGEYIGFWANDEMNGEGTLRWPSGSRYSGAFKNGKRHGLGKLTFADGRIQHGRWQNDKFLS